MDIENYYWNCPNCSFRVDALQQIADSCFEDNGEASFRVDEDGGVVFHTISCHSCGADWIFNISPMILDDSDEVK